ncbi:Holliday junction resolvase RuvX [bacterium]|jgi:putative holliday junction resolvase|nr:Holliday junction resolvase RuvX [bacterium]MBT4649508.1 Holliday junction resolvase RuvX [bacterium]
MQNDQIKKILGIDYGDKRVGLAIAEINSMAAPYKVILNTDLFDQLQQIINDEDIDLLVVGLPHSLSGQTNERLQITEDFIESLKQKFSLSVETVDEQLTSKLYTKMGVTKDIDKHAATAILDTWLAKQKRHD